MSNVNPLFVSSQTKTKTKTESPSEILDKLVDLGALCLICKHNTHCAAQLREKVCPRLTEDLSALQLPEGATNLEHYMTQVAVEEIYEHLKYIRDLVMLVHPEDPYLAMFINPGDTTNPGRIMFNNSHWRLPSEKRINFREPVEEEK